MTATSDILETRSSVSCTFLLNNSTFVFKPSRDSASCAYNRALEDIVWDAQISTIKYERKEELKEKEKWILSIWYFEHQLVLIVWYMNKTKGIDTIAYGQIDPTVIKDIQTDDHLEIGNKNGDGGCESQAEQSDEDTLPVADEGLVVWLVN